MAGENSKAGNAGVRIAAAAATLVALVVFAILLLPGREESADPESLATATPNDDAEVTRVSGSNLDPASFDEGEGHQGEGIAGASALSVSEGGEDGSEADIEPDFVVFGRVVDRESEAPVAGAEVTSVSGDAMGLFTGEFELHHGTTTDTEGRFFLPDPISSVMDLERLAYIQVTADGFVPRLVILNPSTLGTDTELDITLEAGQEITGRVESEAGRPIEGASVIALALDEIALQPGLVGQMAASSVVTTNTGADGRFSMTAPRHGGLAGMLRAAKEGYIPATMEGYTMVEEQVLVLRPAEGTLRGMARWSSGRPLVDGLVTLEMHRISRGGIPIFHTTRTNDSGEFVIENLPTGEYEGRATVQGTLSGGGTVHSPRQRFTPVSGEVTSLDFELADMAILRGRVFRGDSGEGLGGVRLSNIPRDQAHAVNWRLEQRQERREIVTAADGRFSLEVLPVENVYSVYYEMPDGWLGEAGGTTGRMETGNPATELSLKAVAGHVYRGRLVMADRNTGVPDQEIAITRHQGVAGSTTTDESGRFSFTAIPDSLMTLLARTEQGIGRETFLLDETMKTAELIVRLGSTGEISGHVRDAGGNGLGNVRVTVHPSGEPHGKHLASGDTDTQGYFYFEDIPAGEPLGLTAQPIRSAPYSRGGIRQFVLDPNEYRRDLDIILEGTRSLSVYVHNEEGDPIAYARVIMMENRSEGHATMTTMSGATYTDDDGFALIENLKGGEVNYSLNVSASGYQTGNHRLEVGEREMYIVLEQANEVTIRVIDGTTGEPISNYSYIMEQVVRFGSAPTMRMSPIRVRNAPDGTHNNTHVRPGRFRLTVEAEDHSAVGEFRFGGEDGGDPSPWTLEAHPSPEVTALVVHRDSEDPIEGVGLRLNTHTRFIGSNIWYREGVSDDKGRVSFGGVSPGTYNLSVIGDDWGQAETVQILVGPDGLEGDKLVIRIAPAAALRLTVLDWYGEPAPRAVVEYIGGQINSRDIWAPFQTVGEGVFETPLLGIGFFNYRVGLDGYTKFDGKHIRDTTDLVEVTIDLSEYTRVEAAVRYNGQAWMGNPPSFRVHRVDENGVLQQSLHGERLIQMDIGRGRLLARPGIIVPSQLVGSEGWVHLDAVKIQSSSDPVHMEFDMNTRRFDIGIVYPSGEDFVPGAVTVFIAGLEPPSQTFNMDSEGSRRTIGYTSDKGFRLEFESNDGAWAGEAVFSGTTGNDVEHILIDVFPVE